MAKARRFEAQTFVDGKLEVRMLAGPSNFESWRASWQVFRTCVVSLGAAPPSVLDGYEEGIRQLTLLHPNHWGVILRADDTVRSEKWDILLENHRTKGGSPEQGWASIIASSTYGAPASALGHWWWMHVTAPCMHSASSTQPPALVDRIEGVPAGHLPDPYARPHRGGQRGGGKQLPAAKTKAKAKAQQWKDRSKEICNLWNDNVKGCRAQCTWGRRHVCRICGGSHRACEHDKSSH